MSKRKRAATRTTHLPWSDLETSSHVQGQTLPSSWSAEAYAIWFFGFLRADLRALTPGAILGMRADTWAFVGPEIISDKSWGSELLPPVEVLETLQRIAREGIQRVRDGEWFPLENGIVYGIARFGDRVIRGSVQGTFEDLFRAAVMDTVQRFWVQIQECPRCRGLFLKVGKQKFCSQLCARRTHWDAFKGRRPSRDHHGEYARRVKSQLGANVRVSTRPRRKA